jgi:hypothetical protein
MRSSYLMRVRLPRAAPAVRALWEKWALTETTLNVLAVVIAVARSPMGRRALARLRRVEPVDEALARVAGEVLGELRLGRENEALPSVRVLSV